MNGAPIPETNDCRPTGPYGIGKYAATLAALDFARQGELRVNVARTFNLLGPGIPPTLLLGALLERAHAAARSGERYITVGNVATERDFIDVRDAVEAYVTIMKSDSTGEIFNVCTGIPTRIETLVNQALAHVGEPLAYRIDPSLVRSDDPQCVIGDGAKLARMGFEPTITVVESLRDSCAAFPRFS
jgi:GDP-4-dehydro-6-deoxy-D-mannose reductase